MINYPTDPQKPTEKKSGFFAFRKSLMEVFKSILVRFFIYLFIASFPFGLEDSHNIVILIDPKDSHQPKFQNSHSQKRTKTKSAYSSNNQNKNLKTTKVQEKPFYEDTSYLNDLILIEQLKDECHNLTTNKQYPKAYQRCQKLLLLSPDNLTAQKYIEKIQNFINTQLKPIFNESALSESFGYIEQAKEKWKLILKEDISKGKYYEMALKKLNKYNYSIMDH